MNIVIVANAAKVTGQELINLDKVKSLSIVSMDVGNTVLPNEIEKISSVENTQIIKNESKNDYDDRII